MFSMHIISNFLFERISKKYFFTISFALFLTSTLMRGSKHAIISKIIFETNVIQNTCTNSPSFIIAKHPKKEKHNAIHWSEYDFETISSKSKSFLGSLQYLYIMLSNGPEKKVLPNPKTNSPTYNSTVVPFIKRNIAIAVKTVPIINDLFSPILSLQTPVGISSKKTDNEYTANKLVICAPFRPWFNWQNEAKTGVVKFIVIKKDRRYINHFKRFILPLHISQFLLHFLMLKPKSNIHSIVFPHLT